MANVDVQLEQTAQWGEQADPASHIQPGGQHPSQLRWKDLHPEGVIVLPKGSPPAGAGEINWENTLGGRFGRALARLEGLLYAVYGSRPNGDPKRQWYDRQHPRCLWAAEIWQRACSFLGSFGCPTQASCETAACCDYETLGKEYAALGQQPPCCPHPRPQVPIRSRSGDPVAQFADQTPGRHNREVFPLGSIARTSDAFPHDPEGSGSFGATQPGRQDGVGYETKTGDVVTFRWTKPASLAAPSQVLFYFKTRAPGGSWTSWSSLSMSDVGGGVYERTRGPYAHGTEMRWAIRARRIGVATPTGASDGYDAYEPGGSSLPADVDAHYLQWFAHYNPYARGLPEMLDDYGGIDVRHGTDFYQFDGSETVQFEMLDMVRQTIAVITGSACHGDSENPGCGDDNLDVMHHNPRFRPAGDGLCCISMPIKFYWSGSNAFPLYRRGGKGDHSGTWNPLDVRPLVNHPDTPDSLGLSAARRTWRGQGHYYRDASHFDNPKFGGGLSWGTAPGTHVLWYHAAHSLTAQVYAKYEEWGLRSGDVIDPAHIEELIGAIDYLVDYGVWTTSGICTRKKTPNGFAGSECGYRLSTGFTTGVGSSSQETYTACDKCCANSAACSPDDHVLGYRIVINNPDGSSSDFTEYPDTCDPHPAPTWADCRSECLTSKCEMMRLKESLAVYSDGDPATCSRGYSDFTLCDGWGSGEHPNFPGCGAHAQDKCCKTLVGDECEPSSSNSTSCYAQVQGWSYYACTPGACENGWDSNHGCYFRKARYGHVDLPGVGPVATGPPGNEFSGNCCGDIYACGTVDGGDEGDGIWFANVWGVNFGGLVPDWLSGCSSLSCSAGCDYGDTVALPPEVPGMGYFDADGLPICRRFVDDGSGGSPFRAPPAFFCCDGHSCECAVDDWPVCNGNAVWVAVDLNLDNSGRPYRAFNGRDGSLANYTGEGVPRLRPYDLTKDPEEWMHDCPCETWTGAGSC